MYLGIDRAVNSSLYALSTCIFERFLHMQVITDKSGAVFIDRDGDMFLGILNWLCIHKVWHTPRLTDNENSQL